jgi:hypothetical protein
MDIPNRAKKEDDTRGLVTIPVRVHVDRATSIYRVQSECTLIVRVETTTIVTFLLA